MAFTPDGRYLGVVFRSGHSFALFRHNAVTPGDVETVPCCVLEGKESSLFYPASLDFSPIDTTLMISSRMGSFGTTCYRYLGEGKFEKTPYRKLSTEDYLKMGLCTPKGMCISPSGEHIVSIHHQFEIDRHAKGNSGILITDLKQKKCWFQLLGKKWLHSVAFHPSGKYFAATYNIDRVIIYKLTEDSKAWTAIQNFEVVPGPHPKGLAFTPDGTQLAVIVEGKGSRILIYRCCY